MKELNKEQELKLKKISILYLFGLFGFISFPLINFLIHNLYFLVKDPRDISDGRALLLTSILVGFYYLLSKDNNLHHYISYFSKKEKIFIYLAASSGIIFFCAWYVFMG
ncbi:hypothetical protein HON22_06150 [Candidatus Peregrinibacteria bacterium]|jgi:hypothetical protein|nr:hypothetical protein [Candidatus Peregrinibacteria bacterium]